MYSRLAGAALVWLALIGAAAAQTFPANVSARMGRGQYFNYDWTAAQYTADTLKTRDYQWSGVHNNSSTTMLLPSGVFTSQYTAAFRVPNYPIHYGTALVSGWTLAYFQANDPSWILLEGDQATPAFGFGNCQEIPLDIGNPAVQGWRITNEAQVEISTGSQGLSVDNLATENEDQSALNSGVNGCPVSAPAGHAVGTCSVAVPDWTTGGTCTSNGGTFTARYANDNTGGCAAGNTRNNGTGNCYVGDELAYLAALKAALHPGYTLSGNVTYNPSSLTLTADLIGAVDIWLNEGGWMGGSLSPSPCTIGGQGGTNVGAAWVAELNFITGLNSGAGSPRIDGNSICPLATPNSAIVNWVVASHLLSKVTPYDYLETQFAAANGVGNAAYYNDQAPGGLWPQLYWAHGTAQEAVQNDGTIYWRHFANGIAIVNPSNAGDTFVLTGSYHGFDGAPYSGTITVPPKTARLLLPGASGGQIPAH